MYNSQYYTCEQIDQRLLQGYLDDYNSQNNTNLTKEQFLTLLFNTIGRNSTVDNLVTQIGYYECDTAAATAAKTVDASGFMLAPGGSIKVKMTNANSADNATLNINSTGAKALYYDGERASATNSWEAGETVDVYYDGTSYYANNVAGGGKFATGEKVKEVGIDDDLTDGSDNLVKSGVVYNEVRPFIISGTTEGTWRNIWSDENNPIPAGSVIENNGDLNVYVIDSISTSQGSYNSVLIPANSSLTCEWAVYLIRTTNVAGSYSLKVHKNGTLDGRVADLQEKVKDIPILTTFASGEQVSDVSIVDDLSSEASNAVPSVGAVNAKFEETDDAIQELNDELYGTSGTLPTVVGSNSSYPARYTGEQSRSGYYRNYTVDLTGAYARGFRKVRFYGFSYEGYSGLVVQGLITTGDDGNGNWIVESYVPPVSYQAGYCELPITANSTTLVATIPRTDLSQTIIDRYPADVDVFYVPSMVTLISDEEGLKEQVQGLDVRVTALEEGGGGTAAVKFPATYLPKKVYGVIGDTLQIFRRSVVVSNDPYRQYLDFICGQGKIFERYLQIIPEKVSGAVPTNLTIKHCLIADDFAKSEEQTSNLVLADRPSSSPVSNINVLCIGASTTSNGQWASELKRRLTSTRDSGTPAADGLGNITFVGRKELAAASGIRPVEVKVEATGGWTWESFYTPQAAVRFVVSGVTSVDVGTVYSYTNGNGQLVKVSVAEVNITSGSGNIRFIYTRDSVGRGVPADSSGSLTRISSSGGDATIAYSSAEEETYCPFYDNQTEQPDFAHYASLYCNNQIDVLMAYMGNVNEGIRGDSTDEKIAQVVNNMKTLLDAFHADFPNAKVIIGVAAVANPWYGYEEDYTAASANKTWSLRYGLYRYVKAVETFLQGNDYKDWCFMANTHTEVDSESCYPTTTKPANTRTNRLDVIGNNGAHPNIEGYQMVADSMYRCFVNTILQ